MTIPISNPSRNGDQTPDSPFLRLPYELRLAIYEYLLFPSETSAGFTSDGLLPIPFKYANEPDPFVLTVETIDPSREAKTLRKARRRSTYNVHTGPFNTTTLSTTYRIPLTKHTPHLSSTIPSLLLLNRQIHAEAVGVLYSTYTFAFGTHIEAAVPFLSDLTPAARSAVRAIQVTKKPPLWTRESDRCEWAQFCECLARLQDERRGRRARGLELEVRVITGDVKGSSILSPSPPSHPPPSSPSSDPEPGSETATSPPSSTSSTSSTWQSNPHAAFDTPTDYATIPPITRADFKALHRMQHSWKLDLLSCSSSSGVGGDWAWVHQMLRIRGLRDVRVRRAEQMCAVPREGMEFWVAFWRSLEGEGGGFEEWVRSVMILGEGEGNV